MLESGSPPSLAAAVEVAAATEPSAIPETLRRPITLSPQSREIAPSYHVHEQAENGSGDEDGRQRGIIIHRLLELMTSSHAEAPQVVIQRVAREHGLAASDSEYQLWADEAQRLYHDPAMQEVMQPSSVEALNEVPLTYQQAGRTVHGIVDRLLIGANELWVIDYKTHRQATAENHGQLAERFREQLRYYAQGAKRLWPEKRVRTFLLFTACGHLQEVETA